MKYRILLSIILLILIVLLIYPGCGGNNGITEPAGTLPNNNNGTNNETNTGFGSIYIQVKWPERSITDSNGLTTSSMPSGTERLEFKVIEFDNPSNILGSARLPSSQTSTEITPIPLVKAIVKVEAWSHIDPGKGILLAEDEEEVYIIAGRNDVYLNLGEYELTLKADPPAIFLAEQITGSAEESPTPVPLTEGSTTITAKLSDKFQPVSSGSSLPLDGKTVTFRIDTLRSTASGTLSETTAITDGSGECSVELSSSQLGTIVVIAECRPNPDSPDDVYVATYSVPVMKSEEVEKYSLSASQAGATDFQAIPDFYSPVFILPNTAIFVAKLHIINPYTNSKTPVEGKDIEFTIIDGETTTTLTGNTDPNGQCDVSYSITDYEPRYISVKANFYPSPDDPISTSPITATTGLTIRYGATLTEDFERYPGGMYAYQLRQWGTWWDTPVYYDPNNPPEDPNDSAYKNYIDNGSLLLYGPYWLEHALGYQGADTKFQIQCNREYRFLIKTGDEDFSIEGVDEDDLVRAMITIDGIGGTKENGQDDDPDTIYYDSLPLIIFKKNGDLKDCNNETIGTYSSGQWYGIRIQTYQEKYGPDYRFENIKYYYSIQHGTSTSQALQGPEDIGTINSSYYTERMELRLHALRGTVWFDNIEVYNLNNLPRNFY